MNRRKILVIDQDIDEKLGLVCNSALKNAGMNVFLDVNNLIHSLMDELIMDGNEILEDKPILFFDDDEI